MTFTDQASALYQLSVILSHAILFPGFPVREHLCHAFHGPILTPASPWNQAETCSMGMPSGGPVGGALASLPKSMEHLLAVLGLKYKGK